MEGLGARSVDSGRVDSGSAGSAGARGSAGSDLATSAGSGNPNGGGGSSEAAAAGGVADSGTGSGTVTVPSDSQVWPRSSGASSPGTAKLSRQVPGEAPTRLGGSGIAGKRWRRPSASMMSIVGPLTAGRRRRQRPLTWTVRLPPPASSHSTLSIPTAAVPGSSLI